MRKSMALPAGWPRASFWNWPHVDTRRTKINRKRSFERFNSFSTRMHIDNRHEIKMKLTPVCCHFLKNSASFNKAL